jgi:hypothetical protein
MMTDTNWMTFRNNPDDDRDNPDNDGDNPDDGGYSTTRTMAGTSFA